MFVDCQMSNVKQVAFSLAEQTKLAFDKRYGKYYFINKKRKFKEVECDVNPKLFLIKCHFIK